MHACYSSRRETLCGKPWSSLNFMAESFGLVRGPKQHGRGSVSCPDCLRRLDQARDAMAIHLNPTPSPDPDGAE